MNIKFYLFIFIFFGTTPLFIFGQSENENCLPSSKKTQKLIEKAKKSDFREATQVFDEAIQNEPEKASVYYEFAIYAYNKGMEAYNQNPDPTLGNRLMRLAEKNFKLTLDKCADYHSDCHYYLGVINYSFENNKEAVKHFRDFKNFYHEDVNRYSNDHQKRLNDVQEVLAVLEEDISFLENPVPFNPKAVKNVSSEKDEYFPMISPDNELIFYTRRVDRRLKGDLTSDIREEFTWSKRKDMKSLFDSGKPLDYPFNDGTFDSYGASTLSIDNKEMIICACKDERVRGQIYRNCDLYVTYFERTGEGGNDYVWTPLKNLGEGINTPDGWEGQPSLSADGSTLYFTANRPTTQNDDILYSKRQKDGTWGAAQPFTEINTPGKDKSPFFHQDSETFYFVSSVSKDRKGVGGLDIFYIRKEEGEKWSKPKNIGYPINKEEDEIGLFVSIDGKEAYFSSYQKGNWDIYSFELYEEARPQAVVVVKGDISSEDDKPIENVELEIAYSGSDKIEKVRVNGNDGKYAAIVKVEENQDVMINIKKEGAAFDSKIITKEELATKETIRNKDMEIREIKLDEPYTINDVLYQTASAELSERAGFILKQFARFLNENKGYSVLIQGHTDNEGNPQNNLELSDRRANSVKNYLIQLGIEKNRLEAKGYGQTRPKVPNTSTENKQKNRRTDFVIREI